MAVDSQFAFGPFRFDVRTGQLWRDGSEVKLTPRASAVLRALVERAQQVVHKQELFDRVWGGLAVSDDALTSCIQELRGALRDAARSPRYIETRHRRGYRLMVPAAAVVGGASAPSPPQVSTPESARLVGRVAELDQLARNFEDAQSGRRQIVFVSGEAGIGKSALADTFLDQLRAAYSAGIAHGQCLDHHGVGEPYLPLIEALIRLAGGQDGTRVKQILSTQAPSWLAQMPSLWTPSERSALEARSRPTRERMMRELTLAVEAIAADSPLVLKLEDIHWSDASTLDWIAHVARRSEPTRLMVLATFRPADAAATRAGLAGLMTELALHRWCSEIPLNPLSLQAIEAYLKAHLGDDHGRMEMREMADLLLERTGGNPLFMTSIVSQLVQQEAPARMPGALVSIPRNARRFIDQQIDELGESDRNLLTAASVIRREFATAAVAAVTEIDVERVESTCAGLARQGVFIVAAGTTAWPDGTRTELYSFRHDLYRELLYDRMPATRRALSHSRVGRRLEAAWTGKLDMIASELAEHFERGNELARAISHHQRAAAKALRRSANEEAIRHLQRAREAIWNIADDVERTRVEVELLIGLGAAFIAMRGFGAPEVLETYSRAEALCECLGESAEIFPALWGQWMYRWGRSEVDFAWRLCERLLGLAEKSGDAALKLQAHHASWATSFGRGKLADVRGHAEAGLALYEAKIHQAMASRYGNHDAGTCARCFAALSLAFTGEDERARSMAHNALAVARGLNDPFTLGLTLFFASAVAQVLGDVALAAQHAEASMQLATEHDLAVLKAWSTGVVGWCAATSGAPDRGIALLTEAIVALRATQSCHFLCYLLGLLAEAHMEAGHHTEAMKAVEDGIKLAGAPGERYYDAEFHRLRGELLARPPHGQRVKAAASFRAAIKIAKLQGAGALERKATKSLGHWSPRS
jgi:DNA-binding winged helix-turn-helix (wHTH) protein/predicted ATPase